ncbi:MAG: hypothetical protein F6K54_04500 [Okeania sp. SIO3B5]|uniref:hypothetical protein n=1 Tax=Okeania sp. SIO3B5 TaxID=2607811 RepID=UPI0013FF5DFF|nr:hypothetical protein [Okeania sp. SIO3B5]NEO52402.1 hypothetical protein [Okeania sp. SIO3B5]
MTNQDKQINYNYAKGDINNLSGNFQTGVDKRTMRDNIDTQINNSPDLAQAAKDIKDLLNQLSADYPNDSYTDLSAKAVDEVDKNPQLKERIIRGVKAGSFAALKKTIDHPVAQFFIEGVKEVLKKH